MLRFLKVWETFYLFSVYWEKRKFRQTDWTRPGRGILLPLAWTWIEKSSVHFFVPQISDFSRKIMEFDPHHATLCNKTRKSISFIIFVKYYSSNSNIPLLLHINFIPPEMSYGQEGHYYYEVIYSRWWKQEISFKKWNHKSYMQALTYIFPFLVGKRNFHADNILVFISICHHISCTCSKPAKIRINHTCFKSFIVNL